MCAVTCPHQHQTPTEVHTIIFHTMLTSAKDMDILVNSDVGKSISEQRLEVHIHMHFTSGAHCIVAWQLFQSKSVMLCCIPGYLTNSVQPDILTYATKSHRPTRNRYDVSHYTGRNSTVGQCIQGHFLTAMRLRLLVCAASSGRHHFIQKYPQVLLCRTHAQSV